MIFSKESVEAILAGKKTQTRRLVKEKDEYGINPFLDCECVWGEYNPKWCVGRNYAVQLGRGKPGLYYNPKNNETWVKEKNCVRVGFKPLRIVITGIRKERLCAILPEDVKAEGFKGFQDFANAFKQINYNKKPKNESYMCWNPEVWVLDFLVVK